DKVNREELFPVLGELALRGHQFKIIQMTLQQTTVPEELGAKINGMWGSWGPWSACSRTCGIGIMEQKRPCLSATSSYYSESSYPKESVNLRPGHIVSAFRPSIPLHRSEDQLRARLQQSASQSRNGSQHRPGGLRESRHSVTQEQNPKPERRSRLRSSIVPGRYGYGTVPYIYSLQTDTGQVSVRARRQRPIARSQEHSRLRNSHSNSRIRPNSGSTQHPNFYQDDRQSHANHQSSMYRNSPHPGSSDSAQRWSPSANSYSHSSSAQSAQANLHLPATKTVTCMGDPKQHRLCNKDPCPQPGVDMRQAQCTSYNNKAFMGRFYQWEPFTDVRRHQECELNCRAVGFRFYVRQAEQVIDGTPCHYNATSLCVAGLCKNVGCDEYLGSDKVVDKCGMCGGDNTSCKVVSGIFKDSLSSVGYHKIIEIPEGATKINVTEMAKSRNYLALRCRSGRSVINGNWAIDRPGKYEGGGTMFTYKRPNEIRSTAGESFSAEGPTNEALDVFMIYQQSNPGVQYEYILPNVNVVSPLLPPSIRPDSLLCVLLQGEPLNGQLDVTENYPGYENGHFQPGRGPPPEQPTRREYNWKQVGTTECSATCGRGSRYTVFRCVNRNSHQEVSDGLCDASMKPSSEEEACNINACPAFWDIGEWSECSKTCGLGMQHRQILCRQVYANRTIAVQPHRCQHLEKPETTTTCQMKICSEWQIRSEWSSCSVPCGIGQRSRDVKCVSNLGDIVDDEECNMKLRPDDFENCDMGTCAKSWFFSDWSDRCSAECGEGVRTRNIICLTNHISSLPLEGCGNERPPDTQACNSASCESHTEWYTGRWSQCSAECGRGTEHRDVTCIRKTEGIFTVVDSFECASQDRPPSRQSCFLKACGTKWFYTEWSTCSKSCEGGFRVREVRCLTDDMIPRDHCDHNQKPEEHQSCNNEPCVPEIDENCKDKYYNCNVVVQARLCVYSYYKTVCCASCTRGARRSPGFVGHR
uniref:Thrombospondin type 1 domain containing 4 n=1 Tax=Callorhinchus milii TaxID=7868 RepID=A0A4W3IYR2_CALMI